MITFAINDVIDDLLENDASAVENRPNENVVEESVPDVDEEKRCETGKDLQPNRRPSLTNACVDVLKEKLVEPMIEPLPHVGVFVHTTDTARCLWHRNPIQMAERNGNTIVNDVLVVEELTHQIADAEKCQRVEQFQVEVHNDAINVKIVERKFSQHEPEDKSHEV